MSLFSLKTISPSSCVLVSVGLEPIPQRATEARSAEGVPAKPAPTRGAKKISPFYGKGLFF